MTRLSSDGWIALVLLVACGLFLSDLLQSDASGAFVKTTTLPIALVVVLMGLSVALLAGALLRGAPADFPDADAREGLLRVFAMVVWIAVYVFLLPLAGYLAASFTFLVGASYFYGNRRPAVILGWAVLLPTALLLFFEKVMIILLPSSTWFG